VINDVLDGAAVSPTLKNMRKLVSPYGLVSSVTWLPVTEGEADFAIYTGSLGNPGEALAVQQGWEHDIASGNFDGAGGALDRETAAHVAVAESLERYSSCAWDPDSLIWASSVELGDDAIAPAQWPNCSSTEMAHPRCGLITSDPRVPIRWAKGWSLTRNRPVYVPAIQVYLRFPPESPSERYTNPVSTGCAAHGDALAAVTNGILEVVERDAISLTWLQRLRLPRLTYRPEDLTSEQRAFCERGESENVRTLLFDATTDLGIPVVYGLQLADDDPVLAQMVAATCGTDSGQAIAKLFREAASLRIALRALSQRDQSTSDAPEDTLSVMGGALLTGAREHRDRFDFLLDGDRPVHDLSELARPPDSKQALPWLLERLAAAGCEVVVVDITTDEARQVGATVVRVLIPQLMPLSFAHRARYLAHPRLYAAPAAMGHRVRRESELNRHPQPFA